MTTEAQYIADLARYGDVPRTIDGPDGRKFILLHSPTGEKLEEVPNRLPSMDPGGRIRQAVTLETAESLIAYAKAFGGDQSMVFAQISDDKIFAVMDYHTDNLANFTGHTATLKLQRSLEWQAWSGMDGRLVPQLEFVNFLEENREDIVSPDPAGLLEVCRDLQALRKVDFRSVLREGSENYKIEYANDAQVNARKENVLLPTTFKLWLPVYFGGDHVELFALLRWKLGDDNKLSLGFKLQRAERVRQAVFKSVATHVASEANLKIVYGRMGA